MQKLKVGIAGLYENSPYGELFLAGVCGTQR
jgi:hypothetical protein